LQNLAVTNVALKETVAYQFNVDVPNAPKVSDDDRYLAAKVANGDGCPGKEFYISFRNDFSIANTENVGRWWVPM
jgi:hypothetical protein